MSAHLATWSNELTDLLFSFGEITFGASFVADSGTTLGRFVVFV
jgi:hypothetical protein